MRWTATWIALAILLTSCAGTGGATDCAAWRPILVQEDDVLSQPTARAILALTAPGGGCAAGSQPAWTAAIIAIACAGSGPRAMAATAWSSSAMLDVPMIAVATCGGITA